MNPIHIKDHPQLKYTIGRYGDFNIGNIGAIIPKLFIYFPNILNYRIEFNFPHEGQPTTIQDVEIHHDTQTVKFIIWHF